MRIPPLFLKDYSVMQGKKVNFRQKLPPIPQLQHDTVSFSSSTAYYLKKYNTLPREIKDMLTPKDAIDMFKNMEMIQKGISKGTKVGQGNFSRVYENPWLDGYYFLIVQDPTQTTQVIYSRHNLGDSVWSDKNHLLQIIKKA